MLFNIYPASYSGNRGTIRFAVTCTSPISDILASGITGRARVTMRSKGFYILVRPRALLAYFITALSSASSSAGLRDIRPASGKANV